MVPVELDRGRSVAEILLHPALEEQETGPGRVQVHGPVERGLGLVEVAPTGLARRDPEPRLAVVGVHLDQAPPPAPRWTPPSPSASPTPTGRRHARSATSARPRVSATRAVVRSTSACVE